MMGGQVSQWLPSQPMKFGLAGEIMVMSILQGGPAPNFLAPPVYSYISREPLCPNNNTNMLNKTTANKVGSL